MSGNQRLQHLILSTVAKDAPDSQNITYRDRLKNIRTWLALGDENLDVLEAVVSETVNLVLPAALGVDSMELTIANNILRYLVHRDEMTEDQIRRIFQAYVEEQDAANNTSWEHGLGPNWKSQDVEGELTSLLQRPAVSTPLLGTAWRSLRAYTDVRPESGVSYRVDAGVVANPNTPAAVSARIFTWWRNSNSLIAPAWRTQVARDFPELEGLPQGILVDAVASQPVPDVWFQDVFPVPAGVRLVAPSMKVKK